MENITLVLIIVFMALAVGLLITFYFYVKTTAWSTPGWGWQLEKKTPNLLWTEIILREK